MSTRDLTDREWKILAPFFPTAPPGRAVEGDHRTALCGVFHRHRTGCPWRDLPDRFGPWQTVYERFTHLRKSGRLADPLAALQLRQNEAGRIDHTLYSADGTKLGGRHQRAGLPGGGRGGEKKSAAR